MNTNSENCPFDTVVSCHSSAPALFAKKNVTPAWSTRGKLTCPYPEVGPLMEASKEYWIPACVGKNIAIVFKIGLLLLLVFVENSLCPELR